MAIWLFRTILLAIAFLMAAGLTVDYWLLPRDVVELGASLQQQQMGEVSQVKIVIYMILWATVAISLAVAYVGLMLMRHWSRLMAIVFTAMSLVMLPIFHKLDVMIISGWAMGFTLLALILWGAVLTAAFFPPLSNQFVKTNPLDAILKKTDEFAKKVQANKIDKADKAENKSDGMVDNQAKADSETIVLEPIANVTIVGDNTNVDVEPDEQPPKSVGATV